MGPGKRDLLSAVIKRPNINKKKNKTEIRFRTFFSQRRATKQLSL